ncbi:MAG: phosphotransferase, partial [Marinicella sp.]
MHSRDHWHKRLLQITNIHNVGLLEWQAVQSGSSNHMFKVKTNVGIWMIRINRAALGIDRFEEKRIMTLIESLNIGPKVIEINPVEGHLITEYMAQPSWQKADFKDPTKLQRLHEVLNQYHAIPYEYLPSRLDHRLKKYLKSIKQIPVETTMVLLESIQKLDFLGFWKANNTLFHSDLNPNNLLGYGSQTTLIDWEFAGQGHPLLDWLILEHETNIDLSAYYPEDINPVWINPAQRMIQAMMKLWP